MEYSLQVKTYFGNKNDSDFKLFINLIYKLLHNAWHLKPHMT